MVSIIKDKIYKNSFRKEILSDEIKIVEQSNSQNIQIPIIEQNIPSIIESFEVSKF